MCTRAHARKETLSKGRTAGVTGHLEYVGKSFGQPCFAEPKNEYKVTQSWLLFSGASKLNLVLNSLLELIG